MKINLSFNKIFGTTKNLCLVGLFSLAYIFIAISSISAAALSTSGVMVFYSMNFVTTSILYFVLIYSLLFKKNSLTRVFFLIISATMISDVWTIFGSMFNTGSVVYSMGFLFTFFYLVCLLISFAFYLIKRVKIDKRFTTVIDISTYGMVVTSLVAFILFIASTIFVNGAFIQVLLLLGYFFFALGAFIYLNSHFKEVVFVDDIKSSVNKAKEAFKDAFKEKVNNSSFSSKTTSTQGKVDETIIDAEVSDHKED